MEITIYTGKMKAIDFVSIWTRKHGPLESCRLESGGVVIVEVSDEDAEALVDELDRVGLNHDED